MNRRLLNWNGLAFAGLGLALLAGCDYTPPGRAATTKGRFSMPEISRSGKSGAASASKTLAPRRSAEERKAILDNSITLIQGAVIQPGGSHFAEAVRKLNQYYDGTPQAEYELGSAAREYLSTQLGPDSIKELQNPAWTLRDTRHIEDCMMYYTIANRVAGAGDNLTRVRRVFDWIVRQVELVPTGSFGGSRLGPAFARPYDVLVRGMATESEGTGWSERAWLFLSLCRQLDIDAGLITYTKGNAVDAMLPQNSETIAAPLAAAAGRLDLRRADRRPGLPVRRPPRPGGPRPRRPGRGDARAGPRRPVDPGADERPRPGPLLRQPGDPPLQPDEDRHPDRFQPRLLLAEDADAPARAGRQLPGDPLRRPGRAARPLRPGAWAAAPARSRSGSCR